jgi:hypothetical protein
MSGFEAADGVQPHKNFKSYRLIRKKSDSYLWAVLILFVVVFFVCANNFTLLRAYKDMQSQLEGTYQKMNSINAFNSDLSGEKAALDKQLAKLNEENRKLQAFINGLGGYRYRGYENIACDSAEKWTTEGSASLAVADNVVNADPAFANSYTHISTVNPVSKYKLLSFKLKLSGISGYTMISLRNTKPEAAPYATDAYSFVVKTDKIELQKGAAIKATYTNSVTEGPIKEGEWHEYEFGAVDVPGGVEVKLTIDGIKIFDFLDDDNPFYHEGNFVIHAYKNMSIEVVNIEVINTEVINI